MGSARYLENHFRDGSFAKPVNIDHPARKAAPAFVPAIAVDKCECDQCGTVSKCRLGKIRLASTTRMNLGGYGAAIFSGCYYLPLIITAKSNDGPRFNANSVTRRTCKAKRTHFYLDQTNDP
jgi:hypothetical protein